jgi:DNA-binding NtrC family response regulator
MARVLIVEDEPISALEYKDELILAGHEAVGPCASVQEASATLVAEHIDGAIIDWLLRDGSAEPLLKLLIRSKIPLVICSGWPGDIRIPATALTAVVSKPNSADYVINVLEGLMYRRTCMRSCPAKGPLVKSA